MTLPMQTLLDLADNLVGTANNIEAGLAAIYLESDEYDISEIEDQLLDVNCERCPGGCGWWFYSYDLVDDDCDVVGCDQCRPTEQD